MPTCYNNTIIPVRYHNKHTRRVSIVMLSKLFAISSGTVASPSSGSFFYRRKKTIIQIKTTKLTKILICTSKRMTGWNMTVATKLFMYCFTALEIQPASTYVHFSTQWSNNTAVDVATKAFNEYSEILHCIWRETIPYATQSLSISTYFCCINV